MKYLLLIYNNEAEPPTGQELEELIQGHAQLYRELADSGVVSSSASLSESTRATTVRVRGGASMVTDGPFLETKEHLAGYYLVECTEAEAMEIAARIPCGAHGGVEVRPVNEDVSDAVRGVA